MVKAGGYSSWKFNAVFSLGFFLIFLLYSFRSISSVLLPSFYYPAIFFLLSSFHIFRSLSGFVRSHIKKPRLRDYNRVATALRGDTRVALANVAYAESCTRHVRRMRNGEKWALELARMNASTRAMRRTRRRAGLALAVSSTARSVSSNRGILMYQSGNLW